MGERETRRRLRQPRTAEPPSRNPGSESFTRDPQALASRCLSQTGPLPPMRHLVSLTPLARRKVRGPYTTTTLHSWAEATSMLRAQPSSAAETGRANACYTGPINNYGPVVRR
ncbi:hypothetical protein COCVIDRAFT_14009 [Bipolaris victoriae FI3]|uniref:Uncharacterized protein n=1 Tax=Bipolaris victoriae (strain FI3) TaxID=930091 RepID=W7ETE8_BIPV3|nr:hypothetical protein COCVIDRAFT_14009 [Bipolaris victoriae FI3]